MQHQGPRQAVTHESRGMLLYPSPADVDFFQIATNLSRINIYGGAGEKPVSAGQHVLITCEAIGDSSLMQWALLADCWKATLGDVEDFFFSCVLVLARHLSQEASSHIRDEFQLLKFRHANAIHAAAGIAAPSFHTKLSIAEAAMRAAATERRDFTGFLSWQTDAAEGRKPLRKVFRLRAASDVADDLYTRFKTNLPALAKTPQRPLEKV